MRQRLEDRRIAASDPYPLIRRLLVHLTGDCNLRCRHCYAAAHLGALPDWVSLLRVIDLARSFGKAMDLTGGEPFLSPLLGQFVEQAGRHGVEIASIFTNGTLLQESSDLKLVAALFPRVQFFVSIDGFEASHDILRGSGTFERALGGALRLKQLGFRVSINTMLHKALDVHDLRCLYAAVRDHRFDRWRIDTPFDSGRWQVEKPSLALSLVEVFELLGAALGWMLADGLPCEFELDHTLKYVDGAFRYMDTFDPDDPICPCRLLVVWPDGRLTWCQDLYRESDSVGTIDDSPEAIYAQYRPFKARTVRQVLVAGGECLAQCRQCAALAHCGLGCRANAVLCGETETGVDPELCNIYKSGLHLPLAARLRDYAREKLSGGPS